MHIEYEDDELRRLAAGEIDHVKRWPPQVTTRFLQRVQQIAAATDERDLRHLKSLRVEQLKGKERRGQSSLRLNDQYRLIVRFDTRDDGRITVVIDGLDYHKG